MVYGPGGGIRDETDPPAPTRPELEWRPLHEQRVCQATSVVGTAVRPGWVYGKRQGGHFAAFFRSNEVELFGDPNRAYSMVHADDLGEAYAAIVNAPAGNVAGEVFNIVDNSRSSMLQVATAASGAAGFTGNVTLRVASTVWEHSVNHTVLLSNAKAARLLGWAPRHVGFVEEIAKYYRSWKVAH